MLLELHGCGDVYTSLRKKPRPEAALRPGTSRPGPWGRTRTGAPSAVSPEATPLPPPRRLGARTGVQGAVVVLVLFLLLLFSCVEARRVFVVRLMRHIFLIVIAFNHNSWHLSYFREAQRSCFCDTVTRVQTRAVVGSGTGDPLLRAVDNREERRH